MEKHQAGSSHAPVTPSPPRSSWEVRSRLSLLRCYPHGAAGARPEAAFSHQDPGVGTLSDHEAPEEAFGDPWAAQCPLPAGATERLLGLYGDGRVSRALSPGWARGL